MAIDFRSDPAAELRHMAELGVGGVFVDCPATAVAWRQQESERLTPEDSLADCTESQGACGNSAWVTGAAVVISLLGGWAGGRYLTRWAAATFETMFPKYRRLSDEGAARGLELTG